MKKILEYRRTIRPVALTAISVIVFVALYLTNTFNVKAHSDNLIKQLALGNNESGEVICDGEVKFNLDQNNPGKLTVICVGNGEVLGESDAPSGLTAKYYNNKNFTDLMVARVDSQVNFDWGRGKPADSVSANTFSVEWSGKVKIPQDGEYTFFMYSDDGVRLYVNNQKVIENWTDHAPREDAGKITLPAGEYPIYIQYYENNGQAVSKLSWATNGISKQIVPSENLIPDGSDSGGMSPTPTVSPTATPAPTHSHNPSATPSPTASVPASSDGESHSHAYSVWAPTSRDTCSKEIHDGYSVVVDGKRYPTWHPPVDPATGCTFGHEHGRDPNGSDLMAFIKEHYGSTGLPFGLANEKLDEWNSANSIINGMRHEDHVGHKIEWENNVELRRNNCVNTPASPGCFTSTNIGVQCDFLMKAHQGTHSKDAFTNNMHELAYFVNCTDGTKIAATKMVLFGAPGEFTSSDKNTTIKVGSSTPANSTRGNGTRFIPTIDTVKEHILVSSGQWSLFSNGLYEDWLSSNYLYSSTGKLLAYFDPHFAVFSPSRFYDPSKPDNVGRSIDVCYMTENNGSEKARGGECSDIPAGVTYDDPRSPFNGVKREFYFNQTSITNSGGPSVWYTDPFGNNGKTSPFPGSVKQFIAPINNEKGFALESIAIGANRYYGGQGVHAPN